MNRALNISIWLRMFRMKRTNSSYEPGMFNIPAIIIAVLWVMLWFLWPHGERMALKRQPGSFSPRITFVRSLGNLNLRPLPFDVSGASTNDGDSVVATLWTVSRPARIIENNIFAGDVSAGGRMMHGVVMPLFEGMKGYTPVWDDLPVFNSRPDGVMRLTIEPMGALRDYGFQVPEFLADLKKNDNPWMITVVVEIDENGKVENVFLDSGCENREINAVVVRAMYRGSLARIGGKCEGRVKVNYGTN